MQGSIVDIDNLRARYLKAILSGERREALRLVIAEGLELGLSVESLRRDVIQAAQSEIGRLWESNTIGVADEHMATAISQVVLAHVYGHATPARANGRAVLVACVPGEQHDFPARLVADALDLAGFTVRFLGADVPVHALTDAATRGTPDLIALSVTMSFNLPGLRDAVAALRVSAAAHVPIVIGGHGVQSVQLSQELAVAAQAQGAEELVEIAKKLTGLAAA